MMTEDLAARDSCGHAAPQQGGRQSAACSSNSGVQDVAALQHAEKQHAQQLRPLLAAIPEQSSIACVAAAAQSSSCRLRPHRQAV